MGADYFDAPMRNQMRLRWAVATRRQLERWEAVLARIVRDFTPERPPDGADVWAAAIEHHFALIAAHHLLVALEMQPASAVPMDPDLRADVTEGRHLHEHWPENMPVFNVKPPLAEPGHPSGRSFAARYPGRSPYWWLGWNNLDGAQLMPRASAHELHGLLDAVEAEVLAADAELREYVPPRAPSPWVYEGGEWWPKAEEAEQP